MKWWVECSLKFNSTIEIETHFTYSGTCLKRKLTGSTLVGVNIKEVPLNELRLTFNKKKGYIKIGHATNSSKQFLKVFVECFQYFSVYSSVQDSVCASTKTM